MGRENLSLRIWSKSRNNLSITYWLDKTVNYFNKKYKTKHDYHLKVWNSLQGKAGGKRKYQTKLINDVIYKDEKGKYRWKTSSRQIEKLHKRFKTHSNEESKIGQPEWKILFYFGHDMEKLNAAVKD